MDSQPNDDPSGETQLTLQLRAALGEQVDQFFKSDMGAFILGQIEGEVLKGLEILRSVDPADTQTIRNAQNTIWRAESLKSWLESAVMEGIQALNILESRE